MELVFFVKKNEMDASVHWNDKITFQLPVQYHFEAEVVLYYHPMKMINGKGQFLLRNFTWILFFMYNAMLFRQLSS